MAAAKIQKRIRGTIVSIDGRFIVGNRAKVSIEDWGFRYGWGAFETIRVSKGRPVFLEHHLARFHETARALLLTETDDAGWWRHAIPRVIARADATEHVLNLYWTRGEAPRFRGRKIICLRPLPPRRRRHGRVWVAPWRIGPGVPGIGAKTLAYLPCTFSSICAQAAGFTDAVLMNKDGHVADGASASIFLIDKGRLLTPPLTDGALPGITRGVVLALAEKLGITVKVVSLSLHRFHFSDGAFLTSVLRGLRAVSQVDDRKLSMSPEAKVLFGRLRRAYAQAVVNDLADFGL